MANTVTLQVVKNLDTGEWKSGGVYRIDGRIITVEQMGDVEFELKDILEAGVNELFHRQQEASMHDHDV